jgi:hypothetical protein
MFSCSLHLPERNYLFTCFIHWNAMPGANASARWLRILQNRLCDAVPQFSQHVRRHLLRNWCLLRRRISTRRLSITSLPPFTRNMKNPHLRVKAFSLSNSVSKSLSICCCVQDFNGNCVRAPTVSFLYIFLAYLTSRPHLKRLANVNLIIVELGYNVMKGTEYFVSL